jgi:hypothetical protein
VYSCQLGWSTWNSEARNLLVTAIPELIESFPGLGRTACWRDTSLVIEISLFPIAVPTSWCEWEDVGTNMRILDLFFFFTP